MEWFWPIFFLTKALTNVSPNATATVHNENKINPVKKALFIGQVVIVVVVSTPSSTIVITTNSVSYTNLTLPTKRIV